ncbi:MAG TPA: NADH-quinone oxidoreductase subunit N [Chitinophagaceae bacterium]|nr:MAG: proton-translocating NADH-quinone oxidoreductase subunit N [Bacteroidetes bacterium OLB11]HMN33460.1 NADH-quinone oxidoreductase subunit N [Chitinophagaceae bacterium]
MIAIVVSVLIGILLMFSGLIFQKSSQVQILAIFGSIALLAANCYDLMLDSRDVVSYFDMISFDKYSSTFNVLVTGCVVLYLLIFKKNIADIGKNDAEYFALIFFILCGAYLISSFTNLLILFLGIEILSIPQYVLAGSDKQNIKSHEASLKYFLMGAFSTGILLMGITLVYGATGDFNVTSEQFLNAIQTSNALSYIGILLIAIAFAFKVSAAPVHYWTPDVYDGSPTPITALMATIVKISVFLGFIKLFHLSFGTIGSIWQVTISVMIVMTLLFGNITAIFQQSVKRMMAYSSIAQAGFMLFAIFSLNDTSWNGLLLYAVAYTLASLGVFAAITKVKDYTYDGFKGLGKRHPVLAATTVICLLSLTGIPMTAGFFGKYYLLTAAVEQGQSIGIVFFAVLMAAISSYYYFRLISSIYFKEGNAELNSEPNSFDNTLYIINAALIIILGLLPGLISVF